MAVSEENAHIAGLNGETEREFACIAPIWPDYLVSRRISSMFSLFKHGAGAFLF